MVFPNHRFGKGFWHSHKCESHPYHVFAIPIGNRETNTSYGVKTIFSQTYSYIYTYLYTIWYLSVYIFVYLHLYLFVHLYLSIYLCRSMLWYKVTIYSCRISSLLTYFHRRCVESLWHARVEQKRLQHPGATGKRKNGWKLLLFFL